MDKKKGLLNVIVSIGFKIVLLVFSIFTRRLLITNIGNDINGLNSLYLSIINVLSVAELGIGSSIIFSMYKPIVENNIKIVRGLYNLYRKLYKIIAIIILVFGLIVMPFLPYLAKDYSQLNVNLYTTFGLMLISVVLSYAFSSKISLINAYKNNYITTTINSVGMIVQQIIQIIVVVIWKSFELYLIARIVSVVLQWLATEIIARKKYSNIINKTEQLDSDTINSVKKNVFAMFGHKIGFVLVNTADSIIISAFIGVAVLGKFSNYQLIMESIIGVIALFFTPLTSIIGHLCVNEDKTEAKKYFNFFYGFNYVLGCVFFLGYFYVIDDVVTICFGNNLTMAKIISFIITSNYFIRFIRRTVTTFRDATGTFYNDRYKPIIEGITNVILSITLVLVLPEDYKVVGVILSTIITNLVINHIIEPYALFKYGFKDTPKKYFIRNYLMIVVFMVVLCASVFMKIKIDNLYLSFLVNGCLAVLVSMIPCGIMFAINADFRKNTIKIILKFLKKFKIVK